MQRGVVWKGECTVKLLHQEAFYTTKFYIRGLLQQKPFDAETFYTRSQPFTSFFFTLETFWHLQYLYTRRKSLWHQNPPEEPFKPQNFFYTIIPFIPKSFYTRSCLNHEPFTPAGSCAGNTFTPKTKALTPETFYTSRLMHHKPWTPETRCSTGLLHHPSTPRAFFRSRFLRRKHIYTTNTFTQKQKLTSHLPTTRGCTALSSQCSLMHCSIQVTRVQNSNLHKNTILVVV